MSEYKDLRLRINKLLLSFVEDHLDIIGMDYESRAVFEDDLIASTQAFLELVLQARLDGAVEVQDRLMASPKDSWYGELQEAVNRLDFPKEDKGSTA